MDRASASETVAFAFDSQSGQTNDFETGTSYRRINMQNTSVLYSFTGSLYIALSKGWSH